MTTSWDVPAAELAPVLEPAAAPDLVPPTDLGAPAGLVPPADLAAVTRPTKQRDSFIEACRQHPDHLVYFVLNVGDGDTQLLVLPADGKGRRKAMVVDVATTRKLPALCDALIAEDILPPIEDLMFCVVVGSHPHGDHLGGMPEFVRGFARNIGEYWEPGFYHPSGAYIETMVALEDAEEEIQRTQPTGGMTRFLDKIKVTVLSPGIGLRSRFDSYGVAINDASLTLKIEFPATRVSETAPVRGGVANRVYHRLPEPWSLILGADAQTTSWGQVTLDFPQLHNQGNPALYKELRAARGADPLRAQIFKVPHHASKHGVNLELVERVDPSIVLISSTGGGRKYNFPHDLAMEAIREGVQPSTSKRSARRPDYELGIHYTCSVLVPPMGSAPSEPQPLGSIALMLSPRRGDKVRMWRFGDGTRDPLVLANAREVLRPQRRD